MNVTFTISLLDWNDAQARAAPLRRAVFVEEQGVPEELEWDEDDAVSVHAIAADLQGKVIGTGRLLPADATGIARMGRMAVLRDRRRSGVGTAILHALLEKARSRGVVEIALHAQLPVQQFYGRYGFVAVGSSFMEAGILHVEMRQVLRPARLSSKS